MKLKTLLPIAVLGVIAVQSKAAKPVNFIIINLDDAGYGDFSCTGALGYTTPNIDKMASLGMRFTQFHAVQPISGASRAGLLTGCYPNRIHMAGAPMPDSQTGINSEEETIAEILKEKGYTTAVYGKWHLGHQHPFLPLQNGFDEFYGIPYSHDMWPNHPQNNYFHFPNLPTIEGNDVVGYNTDITQFTAAFTNRTIRFIKKNSKRPFLIYLAHPQPHVPLAVSPQFKGKSKQGLYGDVMMELDWSVGEILKTLKENKLEENTLVIVTSDNGPWINYGNHAGSAAGMREGKSTTFQGGNRVTCIMYWKNTIPAGTLCNQLASNIDILPTVAEISKASSPKHKTDGISLLRLLRGDVQSSPRKNFAYYYRQNELQAITDGTYKLIFPHTYTSYENQEPGNNGQPGNTTQRTIGEKELYDLRRDPGERYNLINQHPEIVTILEQTANEIRNDLGDDLQHIPGKNRRPAGTLQSTTLFQGSGN